MKAMLNRAKSRNFVLKSLTRDIEFGAMILRFVSVVLMLAMVLPLQAADGHASFDGDTNCFYVSDHVRHEGARQATLLKLGSAHLLLLPTLASNLLRCGDEQSGVCKWQLEPSRSTLRFKTPVVFRLRDDWIV